MCLMVMYLMRPRILFISRKSYFKKTNEILMPFNKHHICIQDSGAEMENFNLIKSDICAN